MIKEVQGPKLAPAALGVGVTTGVAAMLVGGYRITDCLTYRTGPGQCDEVVGENALALVGGMASLASAWGGFNTLNRRLHPVEEPPSTVPAAAGPRPQPSDKEIEDTLREAFLQAMEVGIIKPVAPPGMPPIPPSPFDSPEDALDDEIIELTEEGHSQRDIADELHITRYRVRKALRLHQRDHKSEADRLEAGE